MVLPSPIETEHEPNKSLKTKTRCEMLNVLECGLWSYTGLYKRLEKTKSLRKIPNGTERSQREKSLT